MANLIKPVYDRLTSKGIKPLLVGMLIFLCFLSSCAIKKGIQSFYTDVEQIASSKPSKNYLSQFGGNAQFGGNTQFGNSLEICSFTESANDNFSLVKKEISKSSISVLMFLILPGFLLSLIVKTKDQSDLPYPSSLLRWSHISLFLQNRLLRL